jgi:spore coat protein CotH
MRRRTGAAIVAALAGVVLFASAEYALTQPGGKGFGPPGGQERKIVKDFDKNGDGWLNKDERATAREAAKKGGGKGGFGKGGFGKGGDRTPAKPGPKVSPGDVRNYPDSKFYDPNVLRTIFLEFENPDWENELQDFHGTDVDVPATLTVDGKQYKNVGVHFRGMSSYMGVPAGYKRSLNVSLDMADKKQKLYGYKALNLLNANGDPSLMSTVLYSQIARQYTPAPKANFVKVVINGESWGVYCSVQQFDKVFLEENYKSSKGTRWKVRGSPGGRGGLEYFGDDVAAYKRVFEMKGNEDEKAWQALINLCKVLNQTPPEKLEEALRPLIDVDGLLWFLALDVALINSDGYWTRASDYTLYLDGKNKFHIIPHDMNEAFRPAGGPGFGGPGGFRLPPPGVVLPPPLQDALQLTDAQKKQLADLQKEVDEKLEKLMTEDQRKQFKEMRDRGPGGFGPPGGPPPGGPGGFGPPPGGPGGMAGGGRGVELDPLVGLNDASKPLRSKVLAVPALREKYLANVRKVAEESLDWKKLGPVVADYRKLLEKEVEADTRKLDSFEAFQRNTDDVPPTAGAPGGRGFGGGMNLRAFAEQRQKYLLTATQPKK